MSSAEWRHNQHDTQQDSAGILFCSVLCCAAVSRAQTLAYRKILGGLVAGGLLKGDVDAMIEAEIGGIFMPHGELYVFGWCAQKASYLTVPCCCRGHQQTAYHMTMIVSGRQRNLVQT